MFLFITIAANACNNSRPTDNRKPTSEATDNSKPADNPGISNASNENVDNCESKVTEPGIFWQSEAGNFTTEFLFKKDGTVKVLNYGVAGEEFELGKWSYDASNHNLQIAWKKSEQVSSEVKSIESDGNRIYFSKDVYRFSNNELRRMKLMDTRFNRK